MSSELNNVHIAQQCHAVLLKRVHGVYADFRVYYFRNVTVTIAMVSDEEHAGGRLIVATETAYSEAKINLNCAYMTQLN